MSRTTKQAVDESAAFVGAWDSQRWRARTRTAFWECWQQAQRIEAERWRAALGACDAALAQCQPCADPECRAEQIEYIETARAAAARLLRPNA